MSRPLLIALANQPPRPGRTGGGSTRELYAWPAGPLWRWRISVAEITQHGPFSAFDGVDRAFAVIQGAGVRLSWPDAAEQEVLMDSAPLHFAGEDVPACQMIDGPTRDLNLMSRRDAGRAAMRRAAAGFAWVSAAPLRALFTAEALSLQIDGQAPLAVAAGTLAISPQAAHQRWQVLVQGQAQAQVQTQVQTQAQAQPQPQPQAQAPAPSLAAPLQAWWLDFLPNPAADRR